MPNSRFQELRDYLFAWHAAVTRQEHVALLYLEAISKGEERRKERIAELLLVNSDHLDTIQAAITDLVNDSDFDIR